MSVFGGLTRGASGDGGGAPPKKARPSNTPEELCNAVGLAVKGEGARVLVMEVSESNSHSEFVEYIVNMVAPLATVQVADLTEIQNYGRTLDDPESESEPSEVDESGSEPSESEESEGLVLARKEKVHVYKLLRKEIEKFKPDVVNMSYRMTHPLDMVDHEPGTHEGWEKYERDYELDTEENVGMIDDMQDTLFVIASGNEASEVHSSGFETYRHCSNVIICIGVDAGNAPVLSARPNVYRGRGTPCVCAVSEGVLVNGHTIDGTSFGAPAISGVAALIKSAHPNYTPRQVLRTITKSARRSFKVGDVYVCKTHEELAEKRAMGMQAELFDAGVYGAGILDAAAALRYDGLVL